MAFVTYNQVRGHTQSMAKSATRVLESAADALEKDVFLSYSHLDRELLAGLVALLGEHGASAYVDTEDKALPNSPSARTAEVLRARIAEAGRFILATSGHIRESRWAPWELGLADGQKGMVKVALFPLVPTSTSVVAVEQEYLDAYARVEYVRIFGDLQYGVYDPRDKNYWTLRTWLHAAIA